MRLLILALLLFINAVYGLSYETACGPLDSHMFAALNMLGKTPAQLRFPNSRPYPLLPAGKDTIPGIEHVVWLMMENHSWDNIFGVLDRPGQDGLPRDCNGKPMTMVPQRYNNGSIQRLYEMPKTCWGHANNPSQNWDSSHHQFNNGSMDGWAIAGEQDKPGSLSYFGKHHLPVLHSLGEIFAINDRYFCSLLGQTWPNRMMALGASSRGIIATGQVDDLLKVEYPNGIIVNKMDDYNVSWVNYFVPNTTSTLGHLFPNISEKLAPEHFREFPDQFMADVKKGELPQFTWIDYNFTLQSMEAPENAVEGDKLIYEIVSALMKGPKWEKTLLILNFDEHGGLYDHVPPVPAIAPDNVYPIIPAASLNHTGYWQYDQYRRTGFRVPLIMISPYSKKNHVSHMVHDHTSVLSFLEHKFNLPALSCRDANANNLFDLLDFDAMRHGTPNFPHFHASRLSPPSSNHDYVSCTPDDPGVIPPLGSVEQDGQLVGPDFSSKFVGDI